MIENAIIVIAGLIGICVVAIVMEGFARYFEWE